MSPPAQTAGRGIMFSPFICPSLIRSFVYYQISEHNISEMNGPIYANWHKCSTRTAHEMCNYGSQEVNDKGHTRLK